MDRNGRINRNIQNLREQIAFHKDQARILKEQLASLEDAAADTNNTTSAYDLDQAIRGGLMQEWQQETWDVLNRGSDLSRQNNTHNEQRKARDLSLGEYKRYGQLRIRDASVCIVGAGGLGCPAAAYLAGSGLGTIGLVDGDVVEVSNLHRQILHSTAKVGMLKVDSIAEYISSLNPKVKVISHRTHLEPATALDILRRYTLILDCTDSPQSRYLISDACVLLNKPLISASALRTEGQLMILNNPPLPTGDLQGGPCYRCIFPRPPPPESITTCGDGGILGPVVGVMGVLQALEAIKLIASDVSSSRPKLTQEREENNMNGVPTSIAEAYAPTLLVFSAASNPPFRTIRLRPRRKNCTACSTQATVTAESLTRGSLDYALFCGILNPVNVLQPSDRISATQYAQLLRQQQEWNRNQSSDQSRKEHILVDTREPVQFDLCSIPGSVNIPFSEITSQRTTADAQDERQPVHRDLADLPRDKDLIVVCRFGNDSQLAVKKFREMGLLSGGEGRIVDIQGGLRAWREEVDTEFPEY
ncbi:MAG: Urmylation protein [Bogoriella megaspora]|nr:MAG: Urmylation protein [Bogoriella megaspora]